MQKCVGKSGPGDFWQKNKIFIYMLQKSRVPEKKKEERK